MATGFNENPKPSRPKIQNKSIKELFDSLGAMKGGSKSATLVLAIVIMLIIGRSCLFSVDGMEKAVIKRFGAVVNIVGPGMHVKLPYPIDTVIYARATELHRMEVGYRTSGSHSKTIYTESHMLTGDENIVSIDFIVQYEISDVEAYLFNLQNVTEAIRLAAEASIREVAGKERIDDLLTTDKERIGEETRVLIQELLDSYGAGVHIVGVELQDIEPPDAVMGAFQDVASAREDKNKYINEAQAYENQQIPAARAQAATILLEAQSYASVAVNRAEGDSSRFSQIYEDYRKSPEITRKRMYLEAMQKIIKNSEVFVVDESIDALNLFPGELGAVGGTK